jgi:ABC-type xylose transport system permease subunit
MQIRSNLQNRLTLGERLAAPTPKFFRKLRTIGVILGSIGAAIIASPIALPAAIVGVAGYLVTAGSVIAAVSSTTVDFGELAKQD